MLDTYLWYEINTSSLFLKTHIKILYVSCMMSPSPGHYKWAQPLPASPARPVSSEHVSRRANPGQVSLRTAGAFSKGT